MMKSVKFALIFIPSRKQNLRIALLCYAEVLLPCENAERYAKMVVQNSQYLLKP